MKKKIAVFQVSRRAVAQTMPSSVAASIGRTILRYAYLEWVQARILDSILGVSIKQGRVVLRVPGPNQYVQTIETLMAFHGVPLEIKKLSKILDDASLFRGQTATKGTYPSRKGLLELGPRSLFSKKSAHARKFRGQSRLPHRTTTHCR